MVNYRSFISFPSFYMCITLVKMVIPFRRELYAASSRGRYGNDFNVTGVWTMNEKNTMHLTLAGGSLWRKKMSICGNKRAPVEHVILFFCLQGTFVSEVWVLCMLWNVLGGMLIRVSASWHLMTHDICILCLGVKHTRSVLKGTESVHCELFSLGKLCSCLSLFSREFGQSSAPRGSGPAIADRGDRRWSLLTSLREELISCVRLRLTRINCWRRMYCHLHLLIQQEVLCWLLSRNGLMRVNEWMMHLYSTFCVLLYTQNALQSCGGVSPQPPPVCSIHLDDATAATGQRHQCAHHTPATDGEERET